MKNSRILAIICTIFNIILIAVCTVLLIRTDRKKPEFRFSPSELIYTSQMKTSRLLENISAMDDFDGDVTDRIVIEKIVKNEKESSVTVFYAVSDSAGNVAKISRIFPAEQMKQTAPEEAVEVMGRGIMEPLGDDRPDTERDTAEGEGAGDEDAVGLEDNDTGDSDEKEEEKPEDSDEKEEEKPEDSDEKEEEKPEDSDETKEDNSEDSGAEESDKPKESDGKKNEKPEEDSEAAKQEKSVNDTEEIPIITLKAAEITTTVGTAPAWVDVIGSLKDDKESYETLFYNLSVSKYDVNKTGSYKVALTTKDSDGHLSDPVTLTIHVK